MNTVCFSACMSTPSFTDVRSLFERSHTLLLLEDFAKCYAVAAPKKLDLFSLAKAQDDFEHLEEVFEQDLRLGQDSSVALWVKGVGYRAVLKAALWYLLKDSHTDPSALLAVKAAIVDGAAKELAADWS